jgi:NADH-quinone oxidoreductase subunit C
MLSSEQIEQAVRNRFPEAVEESAESNGVSNLFIRADSIIVVCAFLAEDPALKFDYLMSLTSVDWPDRFDVVYHLYSIPMKHYIVLKVRVGRDDPVIPSVTSVWNAANWQEREVYDMFGIRFEGHPDLRRILTEESWEGFPLRKDYLETG